MAALDCHLIAHIERNRFPKPSPEGLALRRLAHRKDRVIKPGDKSGAICLLDKSKYIEVAVSARHLGDTSTYFSP